MIPIAGGLAQNIVEGASAAHEAKKQAKLAEQQGKLELAQAYEAQAQALAQQSGAVVGQQAGSVFKAFSKGATNEMIAQTSQATKEVAGNIGAELADQSIKSWFKKHMTAIIVGGVALIGLAVVWFKKSGHPSQKRWNMPVNKTRW
ncbi:hypothetical protein [Flavobacterium sp. ZB4P13]|uniref:hypothetical protein n=1 Tax=Flavobacterium sp. ZB4P13 TaxID=3401728 RepID=UPI003AADDCF1